METLTQAEFILGNIEIQSFQHRYLRGSEATLVRGMIAVYIFTELGLVGSYVFWPISLKIAVPNLTFLWLFLNPSFSVFSITEVSACNFFLLPWFIRWRVLMVPLRKAEERLVLMIVQSQWLFKDTQTREPFLWMLENWNRV